MDHKEILNLKMDNPEGGEQIAIWQYFHLLLTKMWSEGEGFSGKRPFGNSDWKYDIYLPLVASGAVRGSVDEDGYLEEVDTQAADQLAFELIDEAFTVI